MLPPAARLRTSAEFAAVVRSGSRGSSTNVVVHLLPTDRPGPSRAGFVVSRRVGNSVIRHRVTRRLRPLVLERLGGLRPGTDLVVRALPAAATAPSSVLATDLDRALRSALRHAERRATSRPDTMLEPSAPVADSADGRKIRR